MNEASAEVVDNDRVQEAASWPTGLPTAGLPSGSSMTVPVTPSALEAVDGERRKFDRYMIVTMSTIITASPLLGILGTVIGIIQSFELLGGGTSTLTDPRDVAGGIAAALLTTAFGLIVALITLFPYMLFKGQSASAVDRLETLIASTQEGYKEVQKVAVHVGVSDPS